MSLAGSLINVTAEYSDKKIALGWGLPLQEECRQLDIFRVRWTNLQKPKQCVGEEIMDRFVSNSGAKPKVTQVT